MAGMIGTAVRKAKTKFDLAVSLAKLFVGAELAAAVVFPFVDGLEVSAGADAV